MEMRERIAIVIVFWVIAVMMRPGKTKTVCSLANVLGNCCYDETEGCTGRRK